MIASWLQACNSMDPLVVPSFHSNACLQRSQLGPGRQSLFSLVEIARRLPEKTPTSQIRSSLHGQICGAYQSSGRYSAPMAAPDLISATYRKLGTGQSWKKDATRLRRAAILARARPCVHDLKMCVVRTITQVCESACAEDGVECPRLIKERVSQEVEPVRSRKAHDSRACLRSIRIIGRYQAVLVSYPEHSAALYALVSMGYETPLGATKHAAPHYLKRRAQPQQQV
eukprot:6214575-Pleurochrysis_carterae.AAC.2